ncbi:MAG: T9SS type A sorting domain-containing protein [Calditrichia bacterium]
MKRLFILFGLVIFCSVITAQCLAQMTTWHQGINETSINVRGNPVTVGHLNINAPLPGKVLVHFDGTCISDAGDRIVLAASNTPDWLVNDGHTSVEAVDADVNRNSFSHTRVYDVSAGNHDFYAVVQASSVEADGNGEASIYASLTVEFFPNVSNAAFLEHQGIVETSINVRGNPVTVGHLNINAPLPGKVLVHFDGTCISDAGDRIVLAASNTPDWLVNDGHTSVEAVDADVNRNSFSHTRVYDVSAGNHDFYAVVQASSVEADGNGEASVYASLSVVFSPEEEVAIHHTNEIPRDYSLSQNFPNPFNSSTKIKFYLFAPSYVYLQIYNLAGQKIETLVNGYKPTGENEVNWIAEGLPSGIYFYKLQAGEYSETKKLILQK